MYVWELSKADGYEAIECHNRNSALPTVTNIQMIQIISFKTLPLGSSSRPRCEGIGALKHYIAHASKHMPYRAVTGALKHRIVAGALKHRSWSQTL